MNPPFRISIVTPSFNQGNYIEQTIDSVLSQAYSHLEYIIIDGGSTDQSVEIIKKYQKHLSYWVSEPDRGQSHAINKGLKMATGDIFNWLNSDDYLETGALNHIAAQFNDDATLVYTGISNIVNSQGVIQKQTRGTDVYASNLAKTIGWARIDQPETWWRKKVIDQIGPLQEDLHYIMDRDWWIRFLLQHGIDGVRKDNRVLANFRLHDDSKTVKHNPLFENERNMYFAGLASGLRFHDHSEILRKITDCATAQVDVGNTKHKDQLNSAFHYFYVLLAQEAYMKGDFKKSREILDHIQIHELNKNDQISLKTLQQRLMLPAPLINFVRWWRNQ